MLELLPKNIKGKDDINFLMKYLYFTDKDMDIIMHAFIESEKLISADADFKKTVANIFKRLASSSSMLSDDAKVCARIMSNGRYANKAKVLFAQIYREKRKEQKEADKNKAEKPESKKEQITREKKEQYYFWKMQTNQNFREWSESILQRAQPGAKLLLDEFILNANLKLVFASKKPYLMHANISFPFSEDKTMRKHLLMQEVYSNHKLRAIIDSESFKMYLLI